MVDCYYPDQESWTYTVPLQDIEAIADRIKTNHAGKGPNGWFLITKGGEYFHITMNYSNPVNKIKQVLTELNPEIEIRAQHTKTII